MSAAAQETIHEPTIAPAEMKPAPADPALRAEASSAAAEARALVISDQTSYEKAVLHGQALLALRKKIVAHHKPLKDAAQKALDAVREAESKLLEPIDAAVPIVKQKITEYHAEQQRIEQEREQERIREAERQAEEARIAAAVQVEQHGASAEEVSAVLDVPAPLVLPSGSPTAAAFKKAKGSSLREYWSGEVTDIVALCKAIGERKVAPTMVRPHMPAINAMVNAQKNSFSMPGVRAKCEKNTSLRS